MKLHFHTVGAGAPVLILHGLLGSLDNWIPLAEKLAAQFQVLALDLRNHGRSPHAPEFDYDTLAADVVAFLEEHNLRGASVIGHSMGGKVAMRLAQLHPELVARLVVVDMAPREYPPRYARILTAMAQLDPAQYAQRSEVEAALAPEVPDHTIRQFLLKNLRRDDAGKLRWKPNVAALRFHYDHIRGALPDHPVFRGPTLFLRGGQSDYVREPDWPQVQRIFPAAQLVTIASAGHWVHAEAPAEFLQVTQQFLRGEI